MVKAFICSRTTNWQTFDDVHTACPWEAVTNYGDASGFTYWTSGANASLPADPSASHYEFFYYAGENPAVFTNNDYYLGSNGGTNVSNYTIINDPGQIGRGGRSGLLPYNTGASMNLWFRNFGAAHVLFPFDRVLMGAIIDPSPIAIASTGGASKASDVVIPSSEGNLIPTVDFDPQGVYDPITGKFTAPAGATLCVPSFNGSTDPLNSTDIGHYLHKNGVEVARWRHADSLRGPGVGTYGLWPTVEGDEWQFRAARVGSTNMDSIHVSFEFY